MKTHIKVIMLIFLSVMILSGCKKEDPTPANDEAPQLTQNINQFIKDVMDQVYLWYKELPDIDIRYEFDSKNYFKKLLYKDDKWSFITDDIKSYENSIEGKETSYGWSLAFGKFFDTGTIYALVEFVYPGSPAEIAGIKRGDMIYQMNDADITENNYTDLLNSDNVTFTYGKYTDQGITNTVTTTLSSKQLELNPVLFTKIIDEGGHKIGYFLYAQFIDNFDSSIDTVLQHFIDEGVQDVVLDLRYNPGGTSVAAQYLCSALAPANVVSDGDVLVTLQWNDKYQQYWEQHAVQNQLEVRLINSVPVKMGLNKLYILTGQGTASASELSIVGLEPYMDVVTVGETTYGKYTGGAISWKPEDFYTDSTYYADFKNWGIYAIMFRYKNTEGYTDFVNGLTPDIEVGDTIVNGIPLGDVNEPLLKAAIEDITGMEIVAKKSAKITQSFNIFDRGFSKYDAYKRELIINDFDKRLIKKQAR